MLLLKQLNLKKNILLIEAHPIIVKKTTVSGIHKTNEIISAEEKAQRYRTGTVVLEGEIDEEILASFILKGKKLTTLLNSTVLFDASVADKVDFNIEQKNDKGTPIFMNADYLMGIIDEDADVPSISAIDEIDKPAIQQVLEQVDPTTAPDLDSGFGDMSGVKERIIIEKSDNAHGLIFDEKENPFTE